MKRRVHPEGFLEVMRRSPLWTELALLGVVMLGALVMAMRSGNVSNVPAGRSLSAISSRICS